MIQLAAASVAIRIDPRHGGEVVDLIDLRSGRQLLGRPPFASDPPVAGELDETTWTRSYRGGWQLLVPNAGNPCVVDGVEHGFHGSASTDPWEVAAVGAEAAELDVGGSRSAGATAFAVRGDAVTVRSTVVAERTAAFVWVEHIALGVESARPVGRDRPARWAGVRAQRADRPARAHRRTRRGGRRSACSTAPWSGLTARSSPLRAAACSSSRTSTKGGSWSATATGGQGIEISWDAQLAPHLWVWHEVRTTGGPWRELTETAGRRARLGSAYARARAAREHGQVAHRLEPASARDRDRVRPLLGGRAHERRSASRA